MKFLVFLLTLTLTSCFFQPSQFGEQLMKAVLSNLTILQQNIATTNDSEIIAYGLTAITDLPSSYELKDLRKYPSSLIISYMHNREQYTVSLIYAYVMHIMKNLQQNDHNWQLILRNGIVWIVPYISIDNQATIQMANNSQVTVPKLSMKNSRKNVENDSAFIECQKLIPPKSSGVNINYNFLKQIGKEYNYVCDQKYGGPSPLSQKQSLAIQKLFDSLTITAIIDLHVGANSWVYPSQKIWVAKSKYEYAYKNVITQVQKMFYFIREQRTQQYVGDDHLQHFTGGFVNWAALQGALSFRFEILDNEQLFMVHQSMVSAIPIMDMVIKKNAPLYNKYRNMNNTKIYLQSLSLSKFSVFCYLAVKSDQPFLRGDERGIGKDYEVGVGEVAQISVEMIGQIQVDGQKVSYRLNPEIRLYINATGFGQVVELHNLPYVSSVNNEQINLPAIDEDQIRRTLYAGGFVIAVIFIIFTMPFVVDQCQKRKRKDVELTTEQQKKVN